MLKDYFHEYTIDFQGSHRKSVGMIFELSIPYSLLLGHLLALHTVGISTAGAATFIDLVLFRIQVK